MGLGGGDVSLPFAGWGVCVGAGPTFTQRWCGGRGKGEKSTVQFSCCVAVSQRERESRCAVNRWFPETAGGGGVRYRGAGRSSFSVLTSLTWRAFR